MQDWIPDDVWLNVVALGGLDALRDLPESVARNEAAWHAWYDQEAPEHTPIPGYETRLTKFECICLVKV